MGMPRPLSRIVQEPYILVQSLNNLGCFYYDIHQEKKAKQILEEAIRIDGERDAKVKEAGNKDTEETLAMLGLQKGYADRAIDAYARAYKLAKANTKPDNFFARFHNPEEDKQHISARRLKFYFACLSYQILFPIGQKRLSRRINTIRKIWNAF